MIRGIALDLEGTLIDVELVHHRAHIEVARELGLNLTRQEAIETIPFFVGGPDIEVAREIARRAFYQGALSNIVERKRFYYKQFMKDTVISARPGVTAVLKQIRELGLSLAVGSVTPRTEGLRLLRRTSLDHLFKPESLVFAEDVAAVKPSPDVYYQTAVQMAISPTEQIVFEDSPHGVKAAAAAGSIAIAVPIVVAPGLVRSLVSAGAWSVFEGWEKINICSLIAKITGDLAFAST